MGIGELARRTGISPRLLRYYEQQHLLAPHRSAGGHRRYPDDAVERVEHIRALLAAGLSTAVIHDLLPCVEGPGPELERCAAPIRRNQLHDINSRISALHTARSALTGLLTATDPAGGRSSEDGDSAVARHNPGEGGRRQAVRSSTRGRRTR
ncbi:MerR family transcriptional regulator [Nocardia africana]